MVRRHRPQQTGVRVETLELEMLNKLRPYLLTVARGLTKDPGMQQDLAQEGWIAAWRTLGRGAAWANPESIAKKAAVWRMTSVVSRGETFGHSRKNYTKTTEVPVDSFTIHPATIERQLELAYHHGEINEAIESLSPRQREYVKLRFWRGMQKPELTTHFGYEPSRLWSRAKPKLKEQLGHLQERL